MNEIKIIESGQTLWLDPISSLGMGEKIVFKTQDGALRCWRTEGNEFQLNNAPKVSQSIVNGQIYYNVNNLCAKFRISAKHE